MQVTVQPQPKLSLPCTNHKRISLAPREVVVLPGPGEHGELGPGGEQEALSRSVELRTQLNSAGEEGPEHVPLVVLYAQEGGAAELLLALPVKVAQAEPVQRC